jgi:hypothetical protein
LVPVDGVTHKHQSLVPQLFKQLDGIESVFLKKVKFRQHVKNTMQSYAKYDLLSTLTNF